MERFHDAYPTQLQNFVDNLRHDRKPPITIDDAMGRSASRWRPPVPKPPERRSRCRILIYKSGLSGRIPL